MRNRSFPIRIALLKRYSKIHNRDDLAGCPQAAEFVALPNGRVHDTLFLYYGGDAGCQFKHIYLPYDTHYVEKFYCHIEPDTGRRYSLGDINAPGNEAPEKGNPIFEFLGIKRSWSFSKEHMEELYKQGRILQSKRVQRRGRSVSHETNDSMLVTVTPSVSNVKNTQTTLPLLGEKEMANPR